MVHIIGMGVSPEDLTSRHLALINSAEILVGGRRHLSHFNHLDVTTRIIDRKIGTTVDFIQEHMEDRLVVVLASGDPLFFGIGSLIVKRIGGDNVKFHPNISSVAAAFARIKVPWSDARTISLHGRSREFELLAALKRHQYVAVLTDSQKNPNWLALFLLHCGVKALKMGIFSRLGMTDEHFQWYSLKAAVKTAYTDPNIVILKTTPDFNQSGSNASDSPAHSDTSSARLPRLHIGMPETAFEHMGGLITKSDVRTAALGKLALLPGQTLWDLGAGSGSVGVEASLLLGHGRICSVERQSERVEQIRANAQRFGVYNLEAFCLELPAGLADLPRPDRIFIGGGGRQLEAIITGALTYLPDRGVIVINTVLLVNLQTAVTVLRRHGLAVETTQIQIAHSKTMPFDERLEAQNPVWLIRGEMTI